jgi:hypothetical protein
MVRALAGDLARIKGCQVTILRDMRVLDLGVPWAEIIDVHSSVGHCPSDCGRTDNNF